MNGLYSHTCECCKDTFKNIDTPFTYSKDVLARMLADIYSGMNVRDNIHRAAFFETLRIFQQATEEGITNAGVSLEDNFLEAIKTSNEVFSAFRVHRMQNDMAAQLLDSEGRLKPYDKWLQDIATISSHYVERWLETEYNTAVLRAQNAAEWKKFESEQDVYPNLRWMPTTSPTPDYYHKQYWQVKLTLPVNHEFWTRHRPGDRWNCKCELRQTDEPVSREVEFDELKPVPSVAGLDNNPANDGKIFADSHPYYTEAYPGAKEAADKIVKQTKLATAYGNNVTKRITMVEDEIRMNKGFETAVVMDKDGNIVVDKRGSKYQVAFQKNELALMKDAVLTHNHPRGWGFKNNEIGHIGNSFSYSDIALAMTADLAEIRAVTPLYTFSLKRPESGWGVTLKDFEKFYDKQNRILTYEFRELIRMKYITPETASAIHYHKLWQRIAKHYNWNYTKLKTRWTEE